MSAPGIRMRALGKRYPANPLEMLGAIFFAGASSPQTRRDARPALQGIDLEIRAGERVGVLGENGAGKSTLLGILAGTVEPSEGRCEIDGQVTAILTLGTGLREELTGRENVAIAVALHDADRAESVRRIAEAIEFTELGDKIDAPVRTYSTGMKARLAFATLVHGTPEILVIDEALSVGDAFFAAKASAKLKQLCDRGRIAVIVSHSMESLVKLCDRCVWLHAGQVRMDGAPAEVTAAYVKWVRDNDERAMLERYRDHQRADLLDPRLESLELKLGRDDAVTIPILAAGASLDIRLQIGLSLAAGPAHLHLSLSRLDGIKVLEERYPPGEGAIVAAGTRKTLAARVEALPLASGMYVVKVRVDSENAVLGEATAVLEVRAPGVVGGRPLLHSPVQVAVERLGPAGAAA